VQLIVVLAATGDEGHLRALSQLSRLLGRKEAMRDVLAARSEGELLALLSSAAYRERDVPTIN